jgi:prepilin-type N-terminal cleavage/methylation domain-containing protein
MRVPRPLSDPETRAGIKSRQTASDMRGDVSVQPAVMRHRRRVAGESGFTLVETLFAMVIFAGLAVAMAGLLTSAISANKLARERTVAEQAAMEQIEYIRRLPYQDVGILLGNPPGVVASTKTIATGLVGTITTQIRYVDDPTPTSYETTANYKRVTVTVTRDRDGKLMARQVTYVAPSSRTPFGGINLATIQPLVLDYGLNVPVEGVAVSLATGPSAPRNDTTDATGKVSFPKLDPNPTPTCPSDCYDLTASLFGYVQLDAPTRVNVAAGQTATPTIQIYRPVTINVVLQDTLGLPYVGPVTLKMTSGRNGATQTFAVTGGSTVVTALNGEKIIPSVQYTAQAWTTGGAPLCATPVTKYVPDNYPTVLTSTFTLVLGACPSGTVVVTVMWGALPAPAATVTLAGGPYGLSPTSGLTNVAGQITFSNVPSGGGYTVDATKAGSNATQQTISVTTGGTTNVTMALETGTLAVTVRRSGVNQSGATVRVLGGPQLIDVTATTNASGIATFNNVPIGTGYTIKAWRCSAAAPRRSGQLTPVTIAVGTNNRTVNFDLTNVCPLP